MRGYPEVGNFARLDLADMRTGPGEVEGKTLRSGVCALAIGCHHGDGAGFRPDHGFLVGEAHIWHSLQAVEFLQEVAISASGAGQVETVGGVERQAIAATLSRHRFHLHQVDQLHPRPSRPGILQVQRLYIHEQALPTSPWCP